MITPKVEKITVLQKWDSAFVTVCMSVEGRHTTDVISLQPNEIERNTIKNIVKYLKQKNELILNNPITADRRLK